MCLHQERSPLKRKQSVLRKLCNAEIEKEKRSMTVDNLLECSCSVPYIYNCLSYCASWNFTVKEYSCHKRPSIEPRRLQRKSLLLLYLSSLSSTIVHSFVFVISVSLALLFFRPGNLTNQQLRIDHSERCECLEMCCIDYNKVTDTCSLPVALYRNATAISSSSSGALSVAGSK
jgi:hypothetical protein